MPTKTRAGVVGVFFVFGILIFQAIERWSVLDPLLNALRSMGAGGTATVNILLSPLLPLVIAVAAIYLVLEGRKEKRKPALPPQTPTIDNSAKLTASPHIEHHVHLGDSLKPIPQPVPAIQEKKEDFPNVSYVQSRPVLLREDDFGIFHEVPLPVNGDPNALVAQFKNSPREMGKQTPKASSVTAKLVFKNPKNPGKQEIHVSHGTWLTHYEHSATFYSGDMQNLLIALAYPNRVTFENPNSSNPFASRFRPGVSIRHPQQIALAEEQGEVEITLVDGHSYTVFHRIFDYNLSKGIMSLTPHPAF